MIIKSCLGTPVAEGRTRSTKASHQLCAKVDSLTAMHVHPSACGEYC